MLWKNQRQSENIEDRRGMSGRTIAFGGGGLGLLLVVIAACLCGADPQQLLQQMPQDPARQTQPQAAPNQNDEMRQFAAAVMGSTEDVWRDIFRKNGLQYREPTLVLYEDRVSSACGVSGASVGPFYCPGDEKLYLDFSFFRELKNEFRAPGDFAQAYVVAHEVGHHLQNLFGTMDQVNAAQQRSGQTKANQLSVRLELQADCFAGVWAHHAQKKGLLEAGDAEEAIRAAMAVGDDMIQNRAQGYVVPEAFTHGSAKERATWFATGFKAGELRQCRTFEFR
jgi:hypothetical protein